MFTPPRPLRGMLFVLPLLSLLAWPTSAAEPAKTWYKGATHAHTFWSDGNGFPEMVVDWYKSHGFQFVGLSDHNVCLVGERWRNVADTDHPVRLPEVELQKCRQRFGDDWVETRRQGDKLQVRLKTFEEIRARLDEPGKFLVLPNEEIGQGVDGLTVHVNALNLGEFIRPEENGPATIGNYFQAIDAQAQRLGRPILGQLNHPNWRHFEIRTEDILAVPAIRLFEIYNFGPGCYDSGDGFFPSTERMWDVVNAFRIAEQKLPPLFGVASDDAHHYHAFAPELANPGRGWVMVRAAELTPKAIVEAMAAGDFYASCGVVLRDVQFDAASGTLALDIDAQPGVKYTTQFVGTRKDFDRTVEEIPAPDYQGKPQRPLRKYSDQIGVVLATVEGTAPRYTLQGDELYVRAVVTSDSPVEFPAQDLPQTGMAWTQPVAGTRN